MAYRLLSVAHIGNLTIEDYDNLLEKMQIVIEDIRRRQGVLL